MFSGTAWAPLPYPNTERDHYFAFACAVRRCLRAVAHCDRLPVRGACWRERPVRFAGPRERVAVGRRIPNERGPYQFAVSRCAGLHYRPEPERKTA